MKHQEIVYLSDMVLNKSVNLKNKYDRLTIKNLLTILGLGTFFFMLLINVVTFLLLDIKESFLISFTISLILTIVLYYSDKKDFQRRVKFLKKKEKSIHKKYFKNIEKKHLVKALRLTMNELYEQGVIYKRNKEYKSYISNKKFNKLLKKKTLLLKKDEEVIDALNKDKVKNIKFYIKSI